MADFVACHKQSYMKNFDIVSEIKPGGTFLLNTDWDMAGLEEHLPNRAKRIIAERGLNFYTIDATAIAQQIGLGNRTNTVLQSAFFKLSGVLPIDEAVDYMKQAIGRNGPRSRTSPRPSTRACPPTSAKFRSRSTTRRAI